MRSSEALACEFLVAAGFESAERAQSLSEFAQSLTGVGADDPREMALVDKSEIGGQEGEILVPVGQAVERDRDPYSVPELRERHPGDLGKDAADVKARMTERPGQVPEVGARRVCDDRLARLLNDAAVVWLELPSGGL
jgi:hypothetical protein